MSSRVNRGIRESDYSKYSTVFEILIVVTFYEEIIVVYSCSQFDRVEHVDGSEASDMASCAKLLWLSAEIE